jgi:RNA polymerase sigma factor (sigma-70 family)
MSDLELLEQYARENRQEAFAALLDRHLKLVYSAALRQVRSPQLAEEVAQSVFIDLARNAGQLQPGTILTAWLYQVARRTAIDVVRRESRHQLREQTFAMDNLNANPTDWSSIEPMLDDAMAALDLSDRTAILLRYFEEKSLREIGQSLGITEDAAQKRVSRALDELRKFFSKRGRTIGVGALAAAISGNAVQSAPVGLKAAILTHAAITGAASAAGTIAISKTIAMTTLQKALIGATLVAAVGTGVYEAQRISSLQEQLQTVQRPSVPVNNQNDPLHQQLDDVNRQLADLRAENEKLRRDAADLPRLRGEVARLRGTAATAADDATTTAAKAWLARVNQLKDRLQQTPEAKIPEMQNLTEENWLSIAMNKLDTDEDYRKSFSQLRSAAETAFVGLHLWPAVSAYGLEQLHKSNSVFGI